MLRVDEERKYWDKAALDPDVDIKYISDLDDEKCREAVGICRGKILDLGCGVGRLMQGPIYKTVYFGVDISEEMLKIAKKRHPSYNFKVTDGRTIPYRDGFFNKVYSVLLFQHLPFGGVISYIFEAFRVLKPGGTFRFQFIQGTEDEPFSKHHNAKEIVDVMEDAGFKVDPMEVRSVHIEWSWLTGRKK